MHKSRFSEERVVTILRATAKMPAMVATTGMAPVFPPGGDTLTTTTANVGEQAAGGIAFARQLGGSRQPGILASGHRCQWRRSSDGHGGSQLRLLSP